MMRQRLPAPPGLGRPDLGMGHTMAAFAWLIIAAVTGMLLLAMPSSARELRLVFVYGVAGLVGFLAQLIVGVGSRLLPMAAWMQSFVRSGFEAPPVSQYDMQMRPLRAMTLLAWNLGCAGLAAALYRQQTAAVGWSATLLFVATALEAGNRLLRSRYWLAN